VIEGNDLAAELDKFWAAHEAELIEFRRDLHANPETGNNEHRTTRRVALRLAAAGLRPQILPKGTGLLVDIGQNYPERPVVALRADLDALPMADEKQVPYRSTVPGVCHACGHDVHTTILLGAGLFLAAQAEAGLLPGRVRLIFQPAEELGSGALDVLAAGGLNGVGRVFALHCDPRLDAGQLGVRSGAITAACDKVRVRVSGPGGHTARPHLTADLVFALGKIVTELPAALSRRVDPRSSLSLVWGRVSAGNAPNAIPDEGLVEGTIRCLDDEAWRSAPDLVKELVDSVAAAYGVRAAVDYERNVPPTVNDAVSAEMMSHAAASVLGRDAVVDTAQSLGGEDFAWLLEEMPGALARLGTRVPGSATAFDLHQPSFDVDERCVGVGVRVTAATALTALWDAAAPDLAAPELAGTLLTSAAQAAPFQPVASFDAPLVLDPPASLGPARSLDPPEPLGPSRSLDSPEPLGPADSLGSADSLPPRTIGYPDPGFVYPAAGPYPGPQPYTDGRSPRAERDHDRPPAPDAQSYGAAQPYGNVTDDLDTFYSDAPR
jgi:amidohydrolase